MTVTRTMQIEEKIERKHETLYVLRHVNPTQNSDDRMTLVILGVDVSSWKVGDRLTVTVTEA